MFKDILQLFLVFIPYVALITLTFLTVSCTMQDPNKGSVFLDIDPGFQVSTLIPDIDMTPTRYEFHGEGPNSSSFDVSEDQLPVFQTGLDLGEWTITVSAKNTNDIIIAQGILTATIQNGNTIALRIPIWPVSGYGMLDLTVLWNEADIETPSLQGQLIPSTGTPIDLSFTISEPGRAVFLADTIPTGYHTLVVQLLDNDVQVTGAVEVVRIVDNQSTSSVFEFYNINQPGGDMSIDITPEMFDPIDVVLTGTEVEIIEGDSMTLTASVPTEVGNVEYRWYINGVIKGTGETFIIENNLPPGVYRLDVTAFTTDSMRAGSVVHNFTVIEGAQVTLQWDPNTELDLAGYNIHYGLDSGDYPHVVDAGKTEIYTLTGLWPGETYYLTATAYNTAGYESSYSNEVVYTVPL
jgi:hypothetical protein